VQTLLPIIGSIKPTNNYGRVCPGNYRRSKRPAVREDTELSLRWCQQFVIETGVPESIGEYRNEVPYNIRSRMVFCMFGKTPKSFQRPV
jgi:hypothetical protein